MRDETTKLPLAATAEATERPISIATVAMGGQGGGVLTGWIVKLAEDAGWVAQSTSVPGVAQRTGATIYYVEMMPPSNGQKPILAQMPTPGDVDVVLASEFMEAGRSILRGIVTPDRTTLIASNHRSFAIAEKMVPGEGIADSRSVEDAIGATARKQIIFDMETLAITNGSVISASMFGALAGSGALPFEKTAYHAVIEAGGKDAAASIKTFDAAFDLAAGPHASNTRSVEPMPVSSAAVPTSSSDARFSRLLSQLHSSLPDAALPIAYAGLKKVVDYQDDHYGAEYLDILTGLHATDRELHGADNGYSFTVNAAKYLANAMAYDDVIRVADLKTRSTRRTRIENEVGVSPAQILQTVEFMHPRMEEVAGMLPAGVARWLNARPTLYDWLDRRVNKGRRVRTYSLAWFMTLYVLGGMRGLRRRSMRHATETAHRDEWLALATEMARKNYKLGVEVLKCRRLIKGYSDTHIRGLTKFDQVLSEVRRIQDRSDAADWARRLRKVAIKETGGEDLDGAIETIRSFS
ncbi:MAG: indolepyruvate oxidoreductase subunit beta family protein [Pseudolabrys sp.]